jgi:predicted KAP-like P-loop ATPase
MARKKDPKYKKIDLINKIVEMSCSGVSQPEILVWLKNEGECQLSYSYELLREAKPIILETLKDISKDRLETTIRELEQMKMEAKLSGDKKLAIEIQKEINKISGLHNQKIDVTTNGESINQISVIKMIEIKKEDNDNEIEG